MSIEHSEVTSKYFTSKGSMDESLSDFQESKHGCKGPKNIPKPVKSKVKKATKRVKGQKDIRTALQGKKNELVSYAEDFNNVCKKAGLDVDSEQLQLAIALSKSLQSEPSPDLDKPKDSLSSQERIGKIRTTLQEYGFKVPEIKITSNKRVKKHRKQYKLLQTTEAERSQKISDKYSKILFESLDSSTVDDAKTFDYSKAPVFSLSTNIPYDTLRDNSIFYVNNLVEKSTTTFCLLRDWSEIPGRPVSPKLFEVDTMSFDKFQCSQSEIDVILSGSLELAKEVIRKVDDRKMHEKSGINGDKYSSNSNDKANMNDETNKKQGVELLTVTQQYRSCSPDIFDDEISSVLENSTNSNILSQEYKTKVFSQDNNLMELTECANGVSQNSNKTNSQLSQNATKRKSNDLMEITDCIASSSQPIIENHELKIDLTQSPDDVLNEELNNVTPIAGQSIHLKQVLNDNTDVTVTDSSNNVTVLSNRNSTIIRKETDLEKSPEYDIDLTQSPNEENDVTNNPVETDRDNIESMDLTQSSNSMDGLPVVKLDSKNLDKTIILEENEYLGKNGIVKKSILPENNVIDKVFDLTQHDQDNAFEAKTTDTASNSNIGSQSFFEEFEHDHSDSITSNGKDSYNDNSKHLEDNNDIDLTQDSSESDDALNISLKIPNNSSLGKKDDVSIDYDEIRNDTSYKNDTINESNTNTSQAKDNNYIIEVIDQNYDSVTNSSQTSEVFDISDKELDYSLYKSRHNVPVHNFEFGGISIMDDISGVKSFRRSIKEYRRKTIDDSLLPEVIIKGNEPNNIDIPTSSTEDTAACKSDLALIETPNNGKYIVKTDEVTPILDYASMNTPQRNKELDKYGLKPFKRKRAIQLLTHLYNQTHPIVEPCEREDLPSPPKKQKTNPKQTSKTQFKGPFKDKISTMQKSSENYTNFQQSDSERSPLRNSQSPKGKSPKKSQSYAGSVKENICVYEVTTDSPDIRSIECDPDDWVFQKREKAKIHSCRVPLHIALHNYVFSRRGLRESILRYEPVNIDVIHKDLVEYGHRYDPKDLLKFLDKKCITVKTTDHNSRNKR